MQKIVRENPLLSIIIPRRIEERKNNNQQPHLIDYVMSNNYEALHNLLGEKTINERNNDLLEMVNEDFKKKNQKETSKQKNNELENMLKETTPTTEININSKGL
ncbi:MAG: hypothetical protein E7160_02750 [Firmicutes bacterium]|nr:hypothetical protein [Bacillota bacterium]